MPLRELWHQKLGEKKMFTKLKTLFESKNEQSNRLSAELRELKQKIKWARKQREERHAEHEAINADPHSTDYEVNAVKRSIRILDDAIFEAVEKMNQIEAELFEVVYE